MFECLAKRFIEERLAAGEPGDGITFSRRIAQRLAEERDI